MDFQKFCKTLLCKTQIYLGNEYEAQLQMVTKNNGIELTGIMAKNKNTNAHPTIYIDDYYEEGLNPEDMDYIAMGIARSLINAKVPNVTEVSRFNELEYVKNRIMYKFINADRNKDALSKRPHRRWHNLAICYYYLVPSDVIENNATIQINNSHMKMWNVDEEALYELARINTQEYLPYEKIHMKDLIKENLGTDIIDIGVKMQVVTNSVKINGAIAMLYDGVLSNLSKELNDNLYILPSSIHEVIVLPEETNNAKNLGDLVTEVNLSSVIEEEYLADSVYYYDADKDIIDWIY